MRAALRSPRAGLALVRASAVHSTPSGAVTGGVRLRAISVQTFLAVKKSRRLVLRIGAGLVGLVELVGGAVEDVVGGTDVVGAGVGVVASDGSVGSSVDGSARSPATVSTTSPLADGRVAEQLESTTTVAPMRATDLGLKKVRMRLAAPLVSMAIPSGNIPAIRNIARHSIAR